MWSYRSENESRLDGLSPKMCRFYVLNIAGSHDGNNHSF
jgi:hypothetical protein